LLQEDGGGIAVALVAEFDIHNTLGTCIHIFIPTMLTLVLRSPQDPWDEGRQVKAILDVKEEMKEVCVVVVLGIGRLQRELFAVCLACFAPRNNPPKQK